MKRVLRALAGLAILALLAAVWLWRINFGDSVDLSDTRPVPPASAETIARGAYLARIGNCLVCHSARGGAPGAGGRDIATPFGTVYSSNLTPDVETGIGNWSRNAFWRAMHHGRSADGRLLVPVFPYTHTTLLTRADVDALHAYFRSLPPTRAAVPASELRWPFGTQPALALWRALYFSTGEFTVDTSQSEAWNRGAYLVRGVAHCSACHAPRDALGGADWGDLGGGTMPAQGWYAPSLLDPAQASVTEWPTPEIARLLRAGVAEQGRTSGPMAEVVLHGTQYLTDTDVDAVAVYLRALPQATTVTSSAPASGSRPPPGRLARAGAPLYEKHCASCHGEQGEGVAGAYPPLAGNRAVTLSAVDNLLQIVLYGGFNAATAGNPRPYGMPPFLLTLSDAEIAAVLSHIRSAWGNEAGEVKPAEVHALRAALAPAGPR